MSRRKVVQGKSGPPPASEPVVAGNGQSSGEGSGDEADSHELFWRDLMADFGRMVLSAHEADPHRFEQQKVDGSRKRYDFTVALLIIGGAAAVFLLNSVVW